MASIDKIYGTNEQYDEFHAWCKKNKRAALKYFYQREDFNPEDRPITNFPEEIDMWLIENCPIDWVVAYIKHQYGMDEEEKND